MRLPRWSTCCGHQVLFTLLVCLAFPTLRRNGDGDGEEVHLRGVVSATAAPRGSASAYKQYYAGPHSHQYFEQSFGRNLEYNVHDQRQDSGVPCGFDGDEGFSSSSPGSSEFNGRSTYSPQLMCVLFGLCMGMQGAYGVGLTTVFQWQTLEFDYASETERQIDIASGFFVENTGVPIDVDVHYAGNNHDRVFVAIPRFATGIPVTLGIVTMKKYNNNPVVKAYPAWSWQRNSANCNKDRIISVFRIKIDECGRLWVLDAGRIGDHQLCHPQILAFDLATDKLVVQYELPSSQYESRSIFVTPIVDILSTNNQCRNTYVYLADCQTYSIVVYDQMRHTSWRITDKTFYPYPNFGTFKIEGDQFDLMDGVLGMDLTPFVPGKDRKLIYHALSSDTENWVYTSDLRNQTMFEHDPTSSPQIFHTYNGKRSSQSAAMAIDRNGVSFFGNMKDTTMMCWNTATEYGGNNLDVIEKNRVTLQFPSGVKVITNRKGTQELWTLTASFQKVVADTLSKTGPNYRILAGKTHELLMAKRCAAGNNGHMGGHMGGGHGGRYGGGGKINYGK